MSFFQFSPIAKTRNEHRCAWCNEKIEKGAAAVRGSGFGDDGFWSAIEHPECYRACQYEWWNESDEYPLDSMRRGTCLESGDTGDCTIWSSEPVTAEELRTVGRHAKNTRPFANFWPVWKCECGLEFALDSSPIDGSLRWNGYAWEHHHGGQAGHFRMTKTFQPNKTLP